MRTRRGLAQVIYGDGRAIERVGNAQGGPCRKWHGIVQDQRLLILGTTVPIHIQRDAVCQFLLQPGVVLEVVIAVPVGIEADARARTDAAECRIGACAQRSAADPGERAAPGESARRKAAGIRGDNSRNVAGAHGDPAALGSAKFHATDWVTSAIGLKLLVKPVLYCELYLPNPALMAVLWFPNTS